MRGMSEKAVRNNIVLKSKVDKNLLRKINQQKKHFLFDVISNQKNINERIIRLKEFYGGIPAD